MVIKYQFVKEKNIILHCIFKIRFLFGLRLVIRKTLDAPKEAVNEVKQRQRHPSPQVLHP